MKIPEEVRVMKTAKAILLLVSSKILKMFGPRKVAYIYTQ
ncbi:hypothetical protein XOC_0867 [Xanthomonas oryzae pv. oryzicola BLS256]|uniref:Uncharacterized protein n=1 Tax=Xanthomonas oryzae pv. oryzicola (strain BLS256) TaxID=383407 RepID=G7TDT4_XANOB|nr:hypothetical protein XOC_0867 [Xanthomonas oryzae pv. oryzicola BLS256]QEO99060.1 hypothetical protein XOCgx_4073 [Xanthomonas oryzae pv. oryzicola]